MGHKIMIVGDDLFTTNIKTIKKGLLENWANCLLLKVNQIGTISETYKAVKAANESNIDQIISTRSGETEDTTIMHIAVAWGINQIKVWSFASAERMIKWNEVVRIGKGRNN